MPFWQVFYHCVWSTKNRQPLLTADIEPIIYDYLRSKAIGLEGVVYALNGTENHVHLVVSIPPKTAVATFIGQVKGVASTRFNKAHSHKSQFFWQEEYGVFSFDRKRLPYVIAYVERQKEHHAKGTTIPVLERAEGETERPILRESGAGYLINDGEWQKEMLAWETD